jgi:hypothetical protein
MAFKLHDEVDELEVLAEDGRAVRAHKVKGGEDTGGAGALQS